jgi:hypothetical protein
MGLLPKPAAAQRKPHRSGAKRWVAPKGEISFYKEIVMKKILAALLLTLSFAVAAETWRTKNEAGGEIVLTKNECTEVKDMAMGYTYTSEGKVVLFCWTLVGNDVIVVFLDNADMRRYPASSFYKAK